MDNEEPVWVLHKMSFLKKKLKDDVEVAVFRDNGWGGDPESKPIYSIIVDGNGQISFGDISEPCFNILLKDGYLEENTLRTYKDRGYYKYLGPVDIGYCGWKYKPMNKQEGK